MPFGRARKPRVEPSPDGPLEYRGAHGGEEDATIVDASGQEMRLSGGETLCRCGGSRMKPFCDSTHLENGYSSARRRHVMPSNRDDYTSGPLTIHDVRGICAHVAHCTAGSPTVFREADGRPWIDPAGAPVEEIVRTIRDCPSGSLTYSIDSEYFGDWGGAPKIVAEKDGPFDVSGGIELTGTEFATTVPKDHYSLCRCGGSANKPFCDGTHWDNGFKDPGGEDFEGGASAEVERRIGGSSSHGGPG